MQPDDRRREIHALNEPLSTLNAGFPRIIARDWLSALTVFAGDALANTCFAVRKRRTMRLRKPAGIQARRNLKTVPVHRCRVET